MFNFNLKETLTRLRNDESGQGVDTILQIAMIVIPLVIVLVLFGNDVVEMFNDQAGEVLDDTDTAEYER